MFKKDLSFIIKDDGINELIDEKGNMVLMLREVAWNGRDAHLELRKWIVDVDKEQPMKGVSFITPEGPNKLTEVLADKGFGDTEKLLKSLKGREDFDNALIKTIGKTKVQEAKNTDVTIVEEDYYNPQKMFK